jgi:hypothetical protein
MTIPSLLYRNIVMMICRIDLISVCFLFLFFSFSLSLSQYRTRLSFLVTWGLCSLQNLRISASLENPRTRLFPSPLISNKPRLITYADFRIDTVLPEMDQRRDPGAESEGRRSLFTVQRSPIDEGKGRRQNARVRVFAWPLMFDR